MANNHRWTRVAKICRNQCNIFYTVGDCVMPREGIFAKVLTGGEITGINPPPRGIVQLTNSAAPIVTFRLFAFGIGVSTIKIDDRIEVAG